MRQQCPDHAYESLGLYSVIPAAAPFTGYQDCPAGIMEKTLLKEVKKVVMILILDACKSSPCINWSNSFYTVRSSPF